MKPLFICGVLNPRLAGPLSKYSLILLKNEKRFKTMTFTNKFWLNLLIAALLGITASLCQEYIFYALLKDTSDFSYRATSVTSITSVIAFLTLPLFAAWADRVNYANFYVISAITAVSFLLLGTHTDNYIVQATAQFGFIMATAFLMNAAFAKFFYKQDYLTQVLGLIVFTIALEWNKWTKFITFRTSEMSENGPPALDSGTKGWIAVAIIVICSSMVWFLKRRETDAPSVSTTEKTDNTVINGGLLYLLLLGMFLFATLNVYGRMFSFSEIGNAAVSEFLSKNLNTIWLLGALIAAFLLLKLDSYKVMMGSVLTYILCVIVSSFAPDPIATYVKLVGFIIAGGFFTAKIIWAMRTLRYGIIAIFLILDTLFYKTQGLLSLVFRMDGSRIVLTFTGLLSAIAFILFYFHSEKLYQVRYIKGGGLFDEDTDILREKTAIPNFATSRQRFMAALLDVFFIWLFAVLISLVMPRNWTSFLTLIVQITYYLSFESHSGSTLGKKIVGITVIDHAGQAPTMGHAFQRLLSRFIPLGALTILFGSEALHDRLSDTYVVSADQYYHVINDETDETIEETEDSEQNAD
jgi:uncharacterized RDD family membrane protein YckC